MSEGGGKGRRGLLTYLLLCSETALEPHPNRSDGGAPPDGVQGPMRVRQPARLRPALPRGDASSIGAGAASGAHFPLS